jgi:hypothetical protein
MAFKLFFLTSSIVETKLRVGGLHAMEKTWNKITLQWDPPVMASEIRQYRVNIIYIYTIYCYH